MKPMPCNTCGEIDRPSPLSPFGPDERWKCPRCKHVYHHFCSGAADDLPEICDECWCKAHRGDAA